MKWCKTSHKNIKYISQDLLYQVEMDSTGEFTIYGGVIIITVRTNAKICYTHD